MSFESGNSVKQDTFVPAIAEFGEGVEEIGEDAFLHWIIEQLTHFENGSPSDPGEGFTDFESIKHDNIVVDLPQSEIDQVIRTKYQREEYQEMDAYVDDELRTVRKRNLSVVEIYFLDQIVLFRGSMEEVHSAKSRLENKLLEELRLTTVNLTPGIFRRLENFPVKYAMQLDLKETRSLAIKGAEDVSEVRIFGRDKSNEYDRYISEHGKISYLMGYFEFYAYNILSDISEDRIHIRSLDHPDRNIGKGEKLFVMLAFLKRLVEINQSKEGRA
ncbi:hypothetical protein [Halosimplex sp. J119]